VASTLPFLTLGGVMLFGHVSQKYHKTGIRACRRAGRESAGRGGGQRAAPPGIRGGHRQTAITGNRDGNVPTVFD
jgi:hypothetical protein